MTRAEHKAADQLNHRPVDSREAVCQQLDELAATLAHLRDQVRERSDMNAWQLSRLLMAACDAQSTIRQAGQLASLEMPL